MTRRIAISSIALVAVLGITSSPFATKAQDFEPFELNVIGNVAGIPQSQEIERPIFEGLKEASDGRIDVRFRTFQELGMQGPEMARLASRGSFDIVALLAGYISGDAPFFIGVDIPGLAASLDEAKAQSEAYRKVLDEYLQEHLNVKLLTLWPYPLQILYCREPVDSLDDLKGRRIRVHSTALSTLVEAIGGIAVSIPFAEVYTSLQRGVADCAATSSVAGNTQKWYEVTQQIVTLPLGWAISAHVAHKDFWEGLEPGAREFLAGQMATMEQQLWDMARERGEDALSCNMGGECQYGTKGKMDLYRLSDAEIAKVRDIVANSVLANWAEECSAAYEPCVAKWNDTIGEVIGVTVEQ
jgi:TRAP-type C4-dicarboxylate transport system substrate-binding protein